MKKLIQLLILFNLFSNLIFCMEEKGGQEKEHLLPSITSGMDLMKFIKEQLQEENFQGIQNIVEQVKKSGFDLNTIIFRDPLISYFLLDFVFAPTLFKLKVIEYLIQNGVDINKICFSIPAINEYETPLEYVVDQTLILSKDENIQLYYQLIRLLLGYGAIITYPAKASVAEATRIEVEIMKIFNHHEKMIEQARNNPTKQLLFEALSYNKPYIVKLIVFRNPDLVDLQDVKFANIMSPASVELLLDAIKLVKLRELSLEKEIPFELKDYIESYIFKNI